MAKVKIGNSVLKINYIINKIPKGFEHCPQEKFKTASWVNLCSPLNPILSAAFSELYQYCSLTLSGDLKIASLWQRILQVTSKGTTYPKLKCYSSLKTVLIILHLSFHSHSPPFSCLVPGPIRLSFLCSLAYSWVLTREDRGQDIYSLTPNSFSSAISSIFYVRVSFLYFLLYFWPQSLFQYKQEFLLTVKVHNHQIQTPKMSTARILVMTKLAERLPSKW